jgi:tRNA-splicing ligase RtcB
MNNYIEINGSTNKPIKAWIKGVELEEQAKQQLLNIASLSFIHNHIAIMPDVHWGMGATVGSVIPTIGAVIPAAVGVDIGCGMMAVKTSLIASDLPDNLLALRTAIEKAIPHGRTNNGRSGDRGAWSKVPDQYIKDFDFKRLEAIVEKHPKIMDAAKRAPHHIGTLGTGNHFIEICLDENNAVWIMLHSGSRGIGNRIGTYFIELAKEDLKTAGINLVDLDLAYLNEGTKYFDDYIEAISWAQHFARINREIMMQACIKSMRNIINKHFLCDLMVVNCHHNYVQKEYHFGKDVWLTRKGAVCASEGVLGIIPGSMGARSFIVKGKGNKDSFDSCSHGAGRRISRNEAKRRYTLKDHIKATQGVECRKDQDVIDETPMAYKDIDKVIQAQSDLIEVVHTLKQVLCVKG